MIVEHKYDHFLRSAFAPVSTLPARLLRQVDPGKLRHAIKQVVFNQVFVSAPMVVGIYHLMSWRGDPCSPQLPTFHWGLMELAACGIVEEVMFYYSHRWELRPRPGTDGVMQYFYSSIKLGCTLL